MGGKMTTTAPRNPFWLKALVSAFLLAMLLETIRAANSILAGEFGSLASAVAIVGPLLIVVGVLGTVLSWGHNRAGYIIVLGLSTFIALVGFGLVPWGIGTPPITTIADTSGSFSVWIVLMLRVASTLSVILSLFSIVKPDRKAAG